MRILHYLRCETIHRERDFRALDDARALPGRTDLVGSDEILRQRLAECFISWPVKDTAERRR